MNNIFNPGVDQLARLLTAQKTDPAFLAGGLIGTYLKDPFHDWMARVTNGLVGKKPEEIQGQNNVQNQLPDQTNNNMNDIRLSNLGENQSGVSPQESTTGTRNLITNEPTNSNSPILVNGNTADVLGRSLAKLGQQQAMQGQQINNSYAQAFNNNQALGQQASQLMQQQLLDEQNQNKRNLLALLTNGMNGNFSPALKESNNTVEQNSFGANINEHTNEQMAGNTLPANTINQALSNVYEKYSKEKEIAQSNNDNTGTLNANNKLEQLKNLAVNIYNQPFIGEETSKPMTEDDVILNSLKVIKANKDLYNKATNILNTSKDENQKQ